MSAVLTSVEGIYKDGKVDLLETPTGVDEARVIVTFLPLPRANEPMGPGRVDLRTRGITEAEAGRLRHRLKAFADDWEREEMDVYDAV